MIKPEFATIGCASELGALVDSPGLDRSLPIGEPGVPGDAPMISTYAGFARRLHVALDYAGFEKGRGRTGALARAFDVSRETSRKWLSGLALPETDRMIGLAVHAGVSFEWLSTGRGEMAGERLKVRDASLSYTDREELRVVGMVRRLSAEKRRALLVLLSPD